MKLNPSSRSFVQEVERLINSGMPFKTMKRKIDQKYNAMMKQAGLILAAMSEEEKKQLKRLKLPRGI